MIHRLALQHFLDVLRHVGENDAYKDLQYPTVDLKIALLNFNPNMPAPPMVMETSRMLHKMILFYLIFLLNLSLIDTQLLASVKSRVRILMQLYQQNSGLEAIEEAKIKFQKAVIEDSLNPSYNHVK